MRTAVTELGDSRVRVDVGVERVMRWSVAWSGPPRGWLARCGCPGFEKGKVPAQTVIQRVGGDAVLEQALRDSLPEWYERALLENGISPVGDPELNVATRCRMPERSLRSRSRSPCDRRPSSASTGGSRWAGRRPRCRTMPCKPSSTAFARRSRVSIPVDRAAREGDLVLIDYSGTADGEPFEGSEATDLMVELGAESLLPEFDRALAGASAGDEVSVEVRFPDDHRPEALAGKQGRFEVKAKEVREKRLPELDDEFAAEASEFDTLDQLRDELRSRIATALEARADGEFRQAAVEAAAANARIDLPKELVHARAHEMWERLERSLTGRGISPDAYLQMQGKSREELVTELESDAERALRSEATLEAVADAEEIQVSDADMLQALGPGEDGESPDRLLERLRANGRDALLREELRLRGAAELIAEAAKPIPQEQAAARDKLWTPEKEKPEGEGSLWTPGGGD